MLLPDYFILEFIELLFFFFLCYTLIISSSQSFNCLLQDRNNNPPKKVKPNGNPINFIYRYYLVTITIVMIATTPTNASINSISQQK